MGEIAETPIHSEPLSRVPEKGEGLPIDVVNFRRAVGLEDTPKKYLEEKHQKRLKIVHERNQVLFDEYSHPSEGMISDRKRLNMLRQEMYFERVQPGRLLPKERVQRAMVRLKMKLRGVSEGDDFLAVLEQSGSGLVFETESEREGHSGLWLPPNSEQGEQVRRFLPDYKRLGRNVDKEFPLANMERDKLKLGLERMKLLGLNVDFIQNPGLYEEDSEFMNYFKKIVSIPEDQFVKNAELLNVKGVRLNERMFGYPDSNNGEAYFKYSWGAEGLLQTLETGDVPEELSARFRAAEKIHEISDGLVAIPFEKLGEFEPESWEALATIMEYEVADYQNEGDGLNRYYRYINDLNFSGEIIKKGIKEEDLQTIKRALDEGVATSDVLAEHNNELRLGRWQRMDHFYNGYTMGTESIHQRARKLEQYLDESDYPYTVIMRELLEKEKWSKSRSSEMTNLEMYKRQGGVAREIAEIIKPLGVTERANYLMKLELAYYSSQWISDDLNAEINMVFDGEGGQGIRNEAYKFITSSLLCSKDGQISTEVLRKTPDKTKIPSFMIEKYVETQPELLKKYQTLRIESNESSWVDAIPDPELFWKENLAWLVVMEDKGIEPENLLMFRRLANNSNVREILEESSYSKELLSSLRKDIGLNENNITYIDKESLDLVLSKLSGNNETAAFYRTLLATHPREFNGTTMCLQNTGEKIDIGNSETRKMIFLALDEIGAVTPIVLSEYVKEKDPLERAKFVESVKTARSRLLSNEPVRQLFAERENGDELLAELITMSFPGNQLYQVKERLRTLNDRTGDLKEFVVRPEGYEANSTVKAKVALLKEDEKLDSKLFEKVKKIQEEPDQEEDFKKKFEEAVVKLFRGAGSYQYSDFKEELPGMISVLTRDSEMRDLRKMTVNESETLSVTQYYGRVTELIGVYFKDNFAARLEEQIGKDPDLAKRISSNCTPKRLEQIEKNLNKIPDQELAILKPAIAKVKEAVENGTMPESTDLANIMAVMIGNRILGGTGGLRRLVKKELAKFEYKDVEGAKVETGNLPFKGVVSKNVASFFAKTTAGICTAGDTELFNRPEHFHINLVRESEVIGNIQGYVIEYEGKKALLFRGLNPSGSVVNPANAAFYCEGMINIMKDFASDNKIEDVFLAEQLEGWHALTNRVGDGVIDYLRPKYLTKENEVMFDYSITSGGTKISKMYRLRENENKNPAEAG
ncbi:MAG: hypothetical protein ABII80_01260 [bacterium]